MYVAYASIVKYKINAAIYIIIITIETFGGNPGPTLVILLLNYDT